MPGYYQYFWGVNVSCSRKQHTDPAEDRTRVSRSGVRRSNHCAPGGHLGHVTQMQRTKFRSPYPRRVHIKFGFDRASGFGEEDVLKLLMTDDDGRTPDHEYPISSPMSLRLR